MNIVFEKSPLHRLSECQTSAQKTFTVIDSLCNGDFAASEIEEALEGVKSALESMLFETERCKQDLLVLARGVVTAKKIHVQVGGNGSASQAGAKDDENNVVFERSPVKRLTVVQDGCSTAVDGVEVLLKRLQAGAVGLGGLAEIKALMQTTISESEQVKNDAIKLARNLPQGWKIEIAQHNDGPAAVPVVAQGQADRGSWADVREPASVQVHHSGPRLTEEQQAVAESDARDVSANAYAGTGKTTMLIGYAERRRRMRGLYLAFNRGIADEAQRKFGSHVQAKTSHSIAFASQGRKFAKKLGNTRAKDVADFLRSKMSLPGSTPDEEYGFSQLAMNRVKDFFADGSMEGEITDEGTPESYLLPNGIQVDGLAVAKAARVLWAGMQDADNFGIKMPHDGYLKLYVLSDPDLSNFDYILLDEAQDSNSALLTLIQRQTKVRRVLVGDRYQGIYSFRGAVNAMSKLRGAKRFNLTTSFRFGSEIAAVANSILSVYAGERVQLRGGGSGDYPDRPTTAHLHRTNAGLFASAAEWIDRRQGGGGREMSDNAASLNALEGDGLHFVGGVDGYMFDLITDAYKLKSGMSHSISDPFIRKFKSYGAFESYAASVEDKELIARIGIVDKYDQRIPELVAKVKASHVEKDRAALEMSTAHKAKGLEWSDVYMAEDFPAMMSETTNVPKTRQFTGDIVDASELLSTEESNLYYVTATRAQCALFANKQLSNLLAWCKRFPALASAASETRNDE